MNEPKEFHCDYLVIGAGALSLAFVDTLITENKSATVLILDNRDQPGGHWVDSYSFVTLQQPSCFYGVNSQTLGATTLSPDVLSPGNDVVDYYRDVMKQLVASGRVTYLPHTYHLDKGQFYFLDSPQDLHQVEYKKLVIGHYSDVKIPSKTTPAYVCDKGVNLVTPNVLPSFIDEEKNYVVIGAGKTGVDCCLLLLNSGVSPHKICWIVPNDPWFLIREKFFSHKTFIPTHLTVFNTIAQTHDIQKTMNQLEDHEVVGRLDHRVVPQKNRCSTISAAELKSLKKIHAIVREQHIQKICIDHIRFESTTQAIDAKTVCIDCSSDGSPTKNPIPVFENDTITLQTLYTCLPTYSAAKIAYIESHFSDIEIKNQYTQPVPIPRTTDDFIKSTITSYNNVNQWIGNFKLIKFMMRSRLFYTTHVGITQSLRYLFPILATFKRLGKVDVTQLK